MIILHLVRHPRPLIEPGICYGRLDVAAEDPAALAQRLSLELPPGLTVWSSPLQRCRLVAESLHPEPCVDARLAEMNFGAWEGLPWDAIPRAELDAWAADVSGYTPPGGESPLAMQRRAVEFVSALQVPEAVLITHAGIIRCLQAWVEGRTIAESLSIRPDYGSVTTLCITNG